MKGIFIALCSLFFLVFEVDLQAQTTASYTFERDTTYFTYTAGMGPQNIFDNITSNQNLSLIWHVSGTNFPADWQAHTGICDNNTCYSSTQIFSVTGSGPTKTSNTYDSAVLGDFHMATDLDSATTTGCYYVNVAMKISGGGLSTQTMTYMICKFPTAVPTVTQPDEVLLYPNPAQNDVNVVFDGNADIKLIGIYNLIGKPVSVFRVSGNSANMNIENIPTGLYFLRLINSNGDVVLTRKFTKQ